MVKSRRLRDAHHIMRLGPNVGYTRMAATIHTRIDRIYHSSEPQMPFIQWQKHRNTGQAAKLGVGQNILDFLPKYQISIEEISHIHYKLIPPRLIYTIYIYYIGSDLFAFALSSLLILSALSPSFTQYYYVYRT